jgi:hypothetical protein
MGNSRDSKPDWWDKNEALREEMGLAEYEPPRFTDGSYTHETVTELESTYGFQIQFRSDVNPLYPEDWEVLIDGEPIERIGRYRDENGNTIYDVTPDEFRAMVEPRLEDASGADK